MRRKSPTGVVSFIVEALSLGETSPNTCLAKHAGCSIEWIDGKISHHDWTFDNNGRARDAFVLGNSTLLVKGEICDEKRTNRNKSEEE